MEYDGIWWNMMKYDGPHWMKPSQLPGFFSGYSQSPSLAVARSPRPESFWNGIDDLRMSWFLMVIWWSSESSPVIFLKTLHLPMSVRISTEFFYICTLCVSARFDHDHHQKISKTKLHLLLHMKTSESVCMLEMAWIPIHKFSFTIVYYLLWFTRLSLLTNSLLGLPHFHVLFFVNHMLFRCHLGLSPGFTRQQHTSDHISTPWERHPRRPVKIPWSERTAQSVWMQKPPRWSLIGFGRG